MHNLPITCVVLAASLAAGGGPSGGVAADTQVPASWDTFSADLIITHSRVTSDGVTTSHVSTPQTVVHVVRTLQRGVWRTTFEVRSRGPVGDGKVKERPQDVLARVEDAGDGSPLRVFDANGVPRHVPGAAELAAIAGRIGIPEDRRPKPAGDTPGAGTGRARTNPGLDRIVPLKGAAASRKRALEASAGKAQGAVRGLDRYMRQRGSTLLEQLVDPALGVPVESNAVEGGVLVAHTTYDYQPFGRDRLLRRGTRVERRIDGSTDRTVVETRLENVRFERRGGGQ